MRIWLNRTGEVSLREQLTTQVVLGIVSRDLAPGQRLPSTRDLARRYGIQGGAAAAQLASGPLVRDDRRRPICATAQTDAGHAAEAGLIGAVVTGAIASPFALLPHPQMNPDIGARIVFRPRGVSHRLRPFRSIHR